MNMRCLGRILPQLGIAVTLPILYSLVTPMSAQSSAPAVQVMGTLSSLSPSSVSQGQASNQASAQPLMSVPEDFSKLKIAPGFLLHIDVFESPDISGDFRVEEDGGISLPLAGAVRVGGLTPSEAKVTIESRLKDEQLLNHPQVTVSVRQYQPFIVPVIGEVAHPGRIELLAPHSLLDLLSQVGGETMLAGKDVQIKHSVDGAVRTDSYVYHRNGDGDSIKDVMVKPGDTVIVPRAGIVYILGAVNRPGGYLMQEDGELNFAQAISLALGTTLQGKVSDARILRHKPDGTYEVHRVDYGKVMSGAQIPPVMLAEDILYVPVSKTKTIFTTGASLIGAAITSTVYALP
jgi:polysaccharide biosynthesis/export protein